MTFTAGQLNINGSCIVTDYNESTLRGRSYDGSAEPNYKDATDVSVSIELLV
jgi:hypothetical protein